MFSSDTPGPGSAHAVPGVPVAPSTPAGVHPLDALTFGAFSAQTSGDRTARIRTWLATHPPTDQIQQVFRELSSKDKGAARLLREKLDDIKRSRTQSSMAQEWADRAQSLLALTRLNLADALAWQRDAARAGAPLSKEPLASLKTLLVDRIRAIEDLQNRAQVQREAAVLLAQRIELLSTRPWRDAESARASLQADVLHWQSEVAALTQDAHWVSVDVRFATTLQASQTQLLLVWDAFDQAVATTLAAAQDVTAPLPPVPVWADELRLAREPVRSAADTTRPARIKMDPAVKAKATAAVHDALSVLEQEVAQGHGKASAGAANALRSALKDFGKIIDDKLENQAHAALAAAGELEGWQRWRADQLRTELVARAEALLHRPDGQAIGGRKMQDHLRALREQWKLTDQGGLPNHAMWKRFDDACNEAYKVVEAWQERIKIEASEHRAQRLALIDELRAWAAANPAAQGGDWKGFHRVLHQFADRWRESGHISEKLFAELQPLWQAAFEVAEKPLQTVQSDSLAARQAMIDEACVLCADTTLRTDAIKSLQQRWQAEAQRIPMDRRQEQKLWDAFRQPIDDAFQRKTLEREKSRAALHACDQAVLDAARALQAANASGDAQAIRAAMTALERASQGRADLPAVTPSAGDLPATPDHSASPASNPAESVAHQAVSAPVPRRVVAMRGDDRPGQNMAAAPRPGKTGPRGKSADGHRHPDTGTGVRPDRSDRLDRPDRPDRPARPEVPLPRLGDAAFRAQRQALEQAQLALRQLREQAHGQALVRLLSAWETRIPDDVPSVQELGSKVTPAVRSRWVSALASSQTSSQTDERHDALTALLRLEIAAQIPAPAAHQNARRQLQLQMLTRRNDPPPEQTWGQDVATVLSARWDAELSSRLQTVLKVFLQHPGRS